jgi:branched-chain amino acid transport system permease protein
VVMIVILVALEVFYKRTWLGTAMRGVAEQMFDLYVSSNYEILAGLILVLIVLAVRPSGLFGTRAVRQV